MLSRHQQTYIALPELSLAVVARPTVYEYSPARGWRWLQRACFWFLEKIGAHAQETVSTWTRTKRENDDLVASLFGQEGWILEYLHHRGPLRIIMGPDNYKELLEWCHKNGMQHFNMMGGVNICTPENRYGKWHDVPITVVPWMSGAVMVPDEQIH